MKRRRKSECNVVLRYISLVAFSPIWPCTQALDSVNARCLYEIVHKRGTSCIAAALMAIVHLCRGMNMRFLKSRKWEKKMNERTTWEVELIRRSVASWAWALHARSHTQHSDTSFSHSKPIQCFLFRLWTIYMDLYRDVCVWGWAVHVRWQSPHYIMSNIVRCLFDVRKEDRHRGSQLNAETRRNTLAPMGKT